MKKETDTPKGERIERCGYCGQFFRENEYLTTDELNKTKQEILDSAPLGYCPNAQQEHADQNNENNLVQVTRDMAIDAGDMRLEGQLY